MGYEKFMSPEYFNTFLKQQKINEAVKLNSAALQQHVANQKAYDDLLNFDVNAGQDEINNLEAILKKANDLSFNPAAPTKEPTTVTRNGMSYSVDSRGNYSITPSTGGKTRVEAGYALVDSAEKATAAQYEYLKENGYSSVDELRNAISQKKQYLNDAKSTQSTHAALSKYNKTQEENAEEINSLYADMGTKKTDYEKNGKSPLDWLSKGIAAFMYGDSPKNIAVSNEESQYMDASEKYYTAKYGTKAEQQELLNIFKQSGDSRYSQEIKELTHSLYGDSAFDEYIMGNVEAGAQNFFYETAATFNAITSLFGLPIDGTKAYQDLKKSAEVQNTYASNAAIALGNPNNVVGNLMLQTGGNLIQVAMAFIPDLILTVATKGSSGSGATAKSLSKIASAGIKTQKTASMTNKFLKYGSGMLDAVNKGISATAKNPMFWTSFSRTFGTDYETALEGGADTATAYLYATITSITNALVEIGGGVEKRLPDVISGKSKSQILDFIKECLEEGNEEVIQGVITNLNQLLYDSDKEFFSLENEEAIINPRRMLREHAMGTLGGAVLSGGVKIGQRLIGGSTRGITLAGKSAIRNNMVADLAEFGRTAADENVRAVSESFLTNGKITNYDAGVLFAHAQKQINYDLNLAKTPAKTRAAIQKYIKGNYPEAIKQMVIGNEIAKMYDISGIARKVSHREYSFSTEKEVPTFNDIQSDVLYPTNSREASAFNRSLANQTSNLKNTKKSNIMIYTADYAYFVTANGYMSGKIVAKKLIDGNEEIINKMRKEFENGTFESSKRFDLLAQSIRNDRGRGYRRHASLRETLAAGEYGDLDGKPHIGNNRRGDSRSDKSSGESKLETEQSISVHSTSGFSEPDLTAQKPQTFEELAAKEVFGDREYSIEVYSEEQYNNFGWVRHNDVLTASEYSALMSNYTGHKHKDDSFPITRFGETVIHSFQHPRILMYVKGNIRTPQITKVVHIDAEDGKTVLKIKENILKNERAQVFQPYSFVRDYYGERILIVDRKRDYASFQEYKRGREGRFGEKDYSFDRNERNGARGTNKSEANNGQNKITVVNPDSQVQGVSRFNEPDLSDSAPQSFDEFAANAIFGDKASRNEEKRQVEGIAKMLGFEIDWYENPDESDRGYYENGIIHINKNANQAYTVVFTHEFLHHLQNTKVYAKFTEFVMGTNSYKIWIAQNGGYDAFSQNIKTTYEAREGKPMSEPRLRYEIMARFISEGFFTEADFNEGEKAYNLFEEIAQNHQWYRRVRDWFAEMINRLKRRSVQADFIKMQRLLKAAYSKMQSRAATVDGKREYNYMPNISFEEYAAKIREMTPEEAQRRKENGEYVKILEKTPKVILENVPGAKERPVISLFHNIYLELREDGVLPGNYHGLTAQEIISFIENPLAIIETENGRLNLLSVINDAKNNAIVSIELESEKYVNNKNDRYNFVITAFKAYNAYTENAVTKNGVKVWYKKEDLSINHPQLHKWMGNIERKSSNNSIRDYAENSKENFENREYSFEEDKANSEDIYFEPKKERVTDIINKKRDIAETAGGVNKNSSLSPTKNVNTTDSNGDFDLKQIRAEERAKFEASAQRRTDLDVIKRTVNRIDTKLRQNSNAKHVPEELRQAAIEFCSIFAQNDTSVFDSTKIWNVGKLYDALLKKQKENGYGNADPDILEDIQYISDVMQNRRLISLNKTELETVRRIAEHLEHLINTTNEIFIEEKRQEVSKVAEAEIERLSKKPSKIYLNLGDGTLRRGVDKAKEFLHVGNKIPVFFFEEVSGLLEKLYKDVSNGFDKAIFNLQECSEQLQGIIKKHDYKNWLKDKKAKHKATRGGLVLKKQDGQQITVAPEQVMSIYAIHLREEANQDTKGTNHLKQGGIVLATREIIQKIKGDTKQNKKETAENTLDKMINHGWFTAWASKPYRIDDNDIKQIKEYLGKDGMAFVEEVVHWLSTVGAKLGNEASMKLYNINKFGETYYFPIESSSDYLAQQVSEKKGNKTLAGSSFAKNVTEKANTPIVVGNFLDICADHMIAMCAYNALTVPIDNFKRIWNYSAEGENSEAAVSLRNEIKRIFGQEFADYIDQFIKDVDGGIDGQQPGDSLAAELIGKFKKNAVVAKLSVAIQQPASLLRAMIYIEPKYLFSVEVITNINEIWKECMKYNSVAIQKEIGRFDVGNPKSARDYMLGTEYNGAKEKIDGFLHDENYRDDVLGKGPEYADKFTWCLIWKACCAKKRAELKAESKAKANTAINAVKKRITQNMSDSERYEILKDRSIKVAEIDNSKVDQVLLENPELLDKELKRVNAEKILRKVGEEFEVFGQYQNSDIELNFEFGKNNLSESLNKQKGNFDIYAQMLSCFSEVINNAVGIEVHNRNSEGYKTDATLKNVYVLCSAFYNGTEIIPVKLEVKEFSDKPNRLYVAVSLEGIKNDRVVSMGVPNNRSHVRTSPVNRNDRVESMGVPNNRSHVRTSPVDKNDRVAGMGVPNNRSHVRTSPVNISIREIFQKINPKDKDFIKYIPEEFFNPEKSQQVDFEDNMLKIAKMSSVYNVESEKLNKTGKKPSELFSDFFDSLGNEIFIEQFGKISLSKSSVKSEIRHGITAEKLASIEAIPDVLKNGEVIFAETKPDSDVERIVVCAPITIGNEPYYMGVMLQRDSQMQRLYLHNIVIEKEMPSASQADLLTTGALEDTRHLFMTSILQKAVAVKNKYMQNPDAYSTNQVDFEEQVKLEAAKLFKKVIEHTQVYDSVLSRSQNMRSKSRWTQIVTSFMGEATVNLNLFLRALLEFINGNKAFAVKIVGSIVATTFLNALLKSLITALGDDDEDKSYVEKYVTDVGTNFWDDIWPHTWVPLIRDAASIWEGYKIERADMTLVQDLYNGLNALDNDKKSTWDKILDIAAPLSSMTGVPVGNIARDIGNFVKTVSHALNDDLEHTHGLKYAFNEGVWGEKELAEYYEIMRDKQKKGDTQGYTELKEYLMGRGKTEKEIESGVKAAYSESKAVTKQADDYFAKLAQNALFGKLPDEKQEDVKTAVKRYLTESAMNTATGREMSKTNQKAAEAEKKGGSAVNYFLAKASFEDTDNSGGISNEEKIAAINKMNISALEKQVLVMLYTKK